ncbi:sensor histidine kinase [Caulobacter sp. RL271]|uniref:histidine kinase n=1 Tax=Caulobacter segnis TaxID=88688 RepID=A0ABY5A042_9CAUL|nr:ATP-binding protein [Caulobacter segnis]USQ98447.1 ATP-binding protein [Caulobacter segnis]
MTILLLTIVVTVCAMMFWTTRAEVDKVYDGQLITGANVLRALMTDEIKERGQDIPSDATLEIGDEWLSAEDRKAFDAYADWRMFRVWREDRLVLGSDTAPRLPAPPRDQQGFQTSRVGSKTWRIFNLPVHEAGVVIQVGERTSIRSVLVRRVLLELAIPLLLVLPVMLGLIWLALNDGLRAVRALVSAIGGRGARDLSPLDTEAWPVDLRPLAESVNDLLSRLERSYEHERQFIDSAAHQLRTPLAALNLQAQLISEEDDPVERAAQVRQLREGVARASELTEQLLTLARLGPQITRDLTTDLRAEATAALAEIAVVAAAKGVALALEGEACAVKGDPALARLVLANLIENAVTHAPAGSEVLVRLSVDRRFGWVTVADQGPGIPPAERGRVFQRFFRGANATGLGSGLGLAIVEEAARVMNGRVSLDDRDDGESGLEACLGLPRADA